MEFKAHGYQEKAIEKILHQKKVGLFLDLGLGKTIITLTAVNCLLENFAISKCLVIAPKLVAENTWSTEAAKWNHTKGMVVSKIIGSRAKREKALEEDADIYVIGRDNVVWLVEYLGKDWPFDMVVIDELSSFKNPQAKRFKALKRVMSKVDRAVGLTGTPSPNGLMDLWAEIYLLDQGERLGRTIGIYRQAYFKPAVMNGFVVYKWAAMPGAQRRIEELISDICMSMSAEDYLDMPDRLDNEITIKLPDKQMAEYRRMERDQLIEIEDKEIVAMNAAAVMTKLLQMANGAVYSEDGSVVKVHPYKLDKLEEIADVTDSPILVFYSYKHDLEAIQGRFPEARILEGSKDIEAWNAGKIKMLLAHPASVGYGLNLQSGGHVIVWYGLTWSLELYQQANGRLHRQGQQETVVIHHLIAEGTADEQVMRALKAKDTSQSALLRALKERRTL